MEKQDTEKMRETIEKFSERLRLLDTELSRRYLFRQPISPKMVDEVTFAKEDLAEALRIKRAYHAIQ